MSESSASGSRPPTPVTAIPDTAKPYRFNWDPSLRRPGPESVSGTTSDGRGHDYFNTIPQLGNLNLNASSASLALGAVPNEWSSSRHGFNAISTVLNNPHKQQAPPKAHSALPPAPPAELPRVRRKDFDPYLESISAEWERFESTHQPEAGPSTPRGANTKTLPSLEAVPRVFFEHNFNLADPKTFASVTEITDDAEADPAALAHSLPLMDKFSHYADTIELHLTHEISIRSSSFFAALSNLHQLQDESTSCLSQVSRLRDMLLEVDEQVAKRGLDVIQKERQIEDMKKVEEGVSGVKAVVGMSGSARALLSEGKWSEALGIVDALEKTWMSMDSSTPPNGLAQSTSTLNGRLSPLPPTPEEQELPNAAPTPEGPALSVHLSSLRAFSALPGHLRNLTMEIASLLSTDFASTLRDDLVKRISNEADSPPSKTLNERLKTKVEPIMEGLVRTKGLRQATMSWRECALSEVEKLVGDTFTIFHTSENIPEPPNELSSNGVEARAGLGAHPREMSHPEFLHALRSTYSRLLKAIEGLQTQGTLIGEVVGAIYSVRRQSNPDTLQSDFTDILGSATELAHALVAKVIATRSDQHTSLPLNEFCEFFSATWSFVIDCEVLCRRMVVGLRGAVVGQGKAFLQGFHQSRLNQSAKLVEDELWNPRDVSPELQHIVTLLVDSAVKDPPELVLGSSNAAEPQNKPAEATTPNSKFGGRGIKSFFSASSPTSTTPPRPAPSNTTQKTLHVEERTYFTVQATSEVLILLLDYLKFIVNMGMLVTESMSRVIEFLKAFNSRTCQVVLGAGAMRSAGLKNITAKHLALASQSLSIMIALIPYVRETFRRHLSPKQAVMLVEFDKLKRDYQEHQNEIHAKLIAIMGDRLSAHIKSLKSVDWNTPKPGGGVNDYMELLVKETVTLHKVLSRYLAASVVQDVMTQVFAAINHRLSGEYTKIELPHVEAKTRLLADAKFLHQKLSALSNVGVPSNMLETIISEKSLPGPPRVTTPSRSQTLPNGHPAARSSTNLRLKGLLSGKGLAFDKALPTPTPTSPQTSVSSLPHSDGVSQSTKEDGSGDASPLPSAPVDNGRTSQASPAGFKEIEAAKEGSETDALDPTLTPESGQEHAITKTPSPPPPPPHALEPPSEQRSPETLKGNSNHSESDRAETVSDSPLSERVSSTPAPSAVELESVQTPQEDELSPASLAEAG